MSSIISMATGLFGAVSTGGASLYIRLAIYAAVFLAIFGAGFYTKGVIVDAQMTKRLTQEAGQHEAQIKAERVEFKRQMVKGDEIISELNGKLDTVRKSHVSTTKEVIKYVKKSDSCDLARGAVGMLNDARGAGERGDMQKAAELSAEEKHASSSITQRKEIEAHIGCAIEYRALAAKNDALIDFVNDQ